MQYRRIRLNYCQFDRINTIKILLQTGNEK